MSQSWTQEKRSKIFFLFSLLPLLEAYNTIHKYDILSISETYLDSSVSVDDTTLSLSGYNFVQSDHSNSVKGGGICLHY